MTKSVSITKKRIALLFAGGGFLLVAILFIHHTSHIREVTSDTPLPIAASYPGLDLEDPAASFIALRYVTDTGGDPDTRRQAIVWLDEHARTLQPLPPTQETWMLAMLNNGGHSDWDIEYKLWLFNSAFNALHHSKNSEQLTKLLIQLAAESPNRTMRLYALQHIGTQLKANRILPALAPEIYAFLAKQISLPDSEIAGTSLELLASWSTKLDFKQIAANASHQTILDRAREIAADASRPVDVRITALHVADEKAIALARTLAVDSTQPILIRKAAIASIGRHGSNPDLADLELLAVESSRIAQAAVPARAALTLRLTPSNEPTPLPF